MARVRARARERGGLSVVGRGGQHCQRGWQGGSGNGGGDGGGGDDEGGEGSGEYDGGYESGGGGGGGDGDEATRATMGGEGGCGEGGPRRVPLGAWLEPRPSGLRVRSPQTTCRLLSV